MIRNLFLVMFNEMNCKVSSNIKNVPDFKKVSIPNTSCKMEHASTLREDQIFVQWVDELIY